MLQTVGTWISQEYSHQSMADAGASTLSSCITRALDAKAKRGSAIHMLRADAWNTTGQLRTFDRLAGRQEVSTVAVDHACASPDVSLVKDVGGTTPSNVSASRERLEVITIVMDVSDPGDIAISSQKESSQSRDVHTQRRHWDLIKDVLEVATCGGDSGDA